ncbi:MAG TPA: type II toxin-antitoxin system RelE/ParE family toxin [Rubrobacter sp.]|nr:type II toxin-antitoxin system RelE/ParE family toxin [Rubrobacter sp.]
MSASAWRSFPSKSTTGWTGRYWRSPTIPGCTRLSGRDDWRIRVGDYRIVYGIDDERRVVEILNVAHRRDVYRRG